MLKAGFDYSWAEASFGCVDGKGNVIFDENIALPPRNASTLPDWMDQCLASRNLTFNDIGEWSVGNGPGSFTGLRLASAFVMGKTFAKKNVARRAVPTAAAMAHTAFRKVGGGGNDLISGKKVAALFDGRREEILLYGMEEKNGSFLSGKENGVLSSADLSMLSSLRRRTSMGQFCQVPPPKCIFSAINRAYSSTQGFSFLKEVRSTLSFPFS